MKILELLGIKKKTPKSEVNAEETAEKPSVIDYNSAIFERFYKDLENNTLPKIQAPKRAEIEKYTKEREQRSAKENRIETDFVDERKIQANQAIPVDVEIWVDKVYDHYFKKLKPMMGLVHGCGEARKALYKYQGYDWYDITEIYPLVHFD